MSIFGTQNTQFGTTSNTNYNAMKDIEVQSPPDDSVSCLKFSPGTTNLSTFLIAGSWDNNVRCWEVQQSGQTVPKAQQTHQGPVLDCDWSDDGTKVYTASCDKTAKMWDLNTNQAIQIAQHDAPVKSIHWIKAPNYSCVMTGSWDKTLKLTGIKLPRANAVPLISHIKVLGQVFQKTMTQMPGIQYWLMAAWLFWDTRTPNPIESIQLPERCYCADVRYPMAVVGTAERGLIVYQLENRPQEFSRIESPLKFQHRCVSIFPDKKTNAPTGFALGSIEGRVAIHYINPSSPKDNFTFKCHRSNGTTNGMQDIYTVNDIAFHPVHGTLSTVGSDCRFSFWDKDARTKLKTSDQFDQPLTACTFNAQGNVFAYATSYDWSKGHEGFDPQRKPHIFLRPCFDELKPSMKKS